MEKSIKRGSKIWHAIDKILSVWSTAIMALMCVMVIASVLLRYVFNIAYTWSEELIVFLFIYTTYFGSILCVKEKEHIDIPFLRECASDKVGFIMDIFVCLANTAIQASLAIVSFGWIEKTGSSLTAGLKIPYYYIYCLFPICFFIMAIYTIRRLINLIVSKEENKKKGDK